MWGIPHWPSYMGTPLTRETLTDHVSTLDRRAIAFNYSLNASCVGNREWSRSWQTWPVACDP